MAEPASTLLRITPEVWDEFALHPDGPVTAASKAATGQNYVVCGNNCALVVDSGKYTMVPAALPAAAYANVVLPTNGARIGGTFTLSPYSTDTACVALMFWATPFGPTHVGVPDTACHLVIAPGFYDLGRFENGAFTSYMTGGAFGTPLTADGTTLHTVDMVIDPDGSTVTVTLPDGTTMVTTDAYIGSTVAPVACWELYRMGEGDPLGAWASSWAMGG